jgi:hypothetical protein
MDTNAWWLGITLPDGQSIHVNLWTKRAAMTGSARVDAPSTLCGRCGRSFATPRGLAIHVAHHRRTEAFLAGLEARR